MEFGDFFLLAKLHQSADQQLAKSLGTLKRVHVVLTPKRRRGILDLNYLVQSTLKLAGTVCEWEKLSCYDPKGVPALSTAVVAYWIITTVVTCATKVTAFTSAGDKAFDVSAYTSKVNCICSTLEEQLKTYRIKKG
ncbi:hypothetical protein TIFTF001_054737 [Ficus carica]|uniref:Sieve element occlusion N-terminal domain-containing protein n=1 Tax=Ficus carica TaxID=3494 RepID=A0AA88ELQ4_FICCA|nr:hypothetical protein TIFTF001_054737 [Ficus carica]